MEVVLAALVVLAVGGGLAALFSQPRRASLAGAGTCVLAGCIGLAGVLFTLSDPLRDSLSLPWDTIPGAALSFRLDALSALFLVLVFGVSAVIALFAAPFFLTCRQRRPIGMIWLWFNLLVAGMGLTLVANNAVLFLVAWEVMSLAAFFLVTLDDEREDVRAAGWTFLVATHLGAAFLVALFALLGHFAGTLELDEITPEQLPASIKGVLFLLALVGFGAKAGVWPLHVWLPDTYAAAPGPIPALLSGVMSKLGLYGLLRGLTWLGPPDAWWAWLLIGLGAAGAIFGILSALGQHDLKRVLACSSIENIGIILLGLGVGLIGLHENNLSVALLGFGGALFHILNHSVCKSLLFLCSAAVEQATGTLELDRLGGQMKRLPILGCIFLLGAVAISGLPPLNCFASEFLIYLGAFEETSLLGPVVAIAPLTCIATLALAGGLAVACFSRAFAVIFLGSPRQESGGGDPSSGRVSGAGQPDLLESRQVEWWSQPATGILAIGCIMLGVGAPLVAESLAGVLALLGGASIADTRELFLDKSRPLWDVGLVVAISVSLLMGLVLLRWLLLRHRELHESDTWGCGYTKATPRIQYTGSSFVQPLLDVFAPLLGWRRRKPTITRYFPARGEIESLETTARDPAVEAGYRPIFSGIARLLGWLHFLQAGRVQIYVLYIVVTLLVLLVGTLGAR